MTAIHLVRSSHKGVPQWNPLVVSGMTSNRRGVGHQLVPQWSPLVVSGMTTGPGPLVLPLRGAAMEPARGERDDGACPPPLHVESAPQSKPARGERDDEPNGLSAARNSGQPQSSPLVVSGMTQI